MPSGYVIVAGLPQTPAFPAVGYTWRDLASLNDLLYNQRKDLTYAQIRDKLLDSHGKVLASLELVDDDVLTATDAIEWLGNESLADVAHENLGGHYEWAHGVLDAAHMPSA